MSSSTFPTAIPDDHEAIQYRALSVDAVVSLILGVLSIVIIPSALNSLSGCLIVLPLPLMGLVVGLRSLRAIRQQPDRLSGTSLARVGAAASALFLLAGPAIAGYIYATEVPEGYERISFYALRPAGADPTGMGATAAESPLTPEVMRLDGQQVFIKGYMRESSYRNNLDNFLLVRDNKTCCFGPLDEVKFFDQIHVMLERPRVTDYTSRVVNTAGRLRIHPENVGRGPGFPVFTLTADHIN
jgi:hypothetical protein